MMMKMAGALIMNFPLVQDFNKFQINFKNEKDYFSDYNFPIEFYCNW